MKTGLSVILAAPTRFQGGMFLERLSLLEEFLKGSGRSWEVLVHAPDPRPAIRGQIEKRDLYRWIEGAEGSSFRQALDSAQFPWVWVWDPNGFIPPKEAEVLLAELDQGFDVVVGSRFLSETVIQPRTAPGYVRGQWLRNALMRLCVRGGFWDYTSGCFAFQKEVWEALKASKPRIPARNPNAFLIDLIRSDAKIKEKGIMWIPARPVTS